ncbi:Rpn family recombination-promoting nuclease/putative transposase [Sporosarcina cascadiensis]|uniref:Rpn family recombination-promoting nuclease/putative transposase n=1 Tax=Sporosarcina cascadiensis TaxID=2660747 RepID=UPI00189154DA|nr:Rpn family recombination-promoting nuclease/putative transposase [Sporosarcina cascadiensis]
MKIDFAFKELFGSEKNKAITIVFLNAILKRTGPNVIKEVTFNNLEIGRKHGEDKQSRLDILVTTQDQHQVNIEIQFTNQYDMINRSLYYWARLYSNQNQKGMAYTKLKPAIVVSILNFNLVEETKSYHTAYHLHEDEENFRLTDVMELHFIEIPKLLKHWEEEKLDPWSDVLSRWLLLFSIVDQRKSYIYEDIYKELEAIVVNDKHLQDAFTNWNELSLDPKERQAYEVRLKQILDQEAAVNEAKWRLEVAEKQALERGMEKATAQMARKMLEKHMNVEEVAELTGLPIERMQKIKAELNL